MRILNWPARGIGERTEQELQRWADELGVPLFQALRELESGTPRAPFTARISSALITFTQLLDELSRAGRELPPPALLDRITDRVAIREALKRE